MGCEGQQGCETSRIPRFLDNRLTDGGVCQSYAPAALYTKEYFWLRFLFEAESIQERLEGRQKNS
jgi:hypothetical protein